ncbi:MAG: alpha/beta hydrolase [Anaerolineae bacterium]|nr:alpha/beta hydrolase [Gemmatimonadaceae bacterium]
MSITSRVSEKYTTPTGEFVFHVEFRSRHLAGERKVLIYLPPGYSAQPLRRFPVLYLHDGQNLFNHPQADGSVERWSCELTIDALLQKGNVEPLIVVGIWNAGHERIEEYAPTRNERLGAGGKLVQHGEMIVRDLKPFVDSHYRTLSNASNTGIGGSSLGALASLYLGISNSATFGKILAISPSIWWDDRMILRDVEALTERPPLRIFLSAGTAEGREVVPNARRLRRALVKKGWRVGSDLEYLEARDGRHHESSWGLAFAPALQFLFPVGQGVDLGGLERL